MLAAANYPREYIGDCRTRMEAQLAAYRALASSAGKNGSPVEAFEPLFFANLTLALDACFVHRTRAVEGKDGNPLNEVRMLCSSILGNHGILAADKTIKYKPETSVLKLEIGDEIRLDEERFGRLLEAFFSELEQKFT
jgi:hypothetical protein